MTDKERNLALYIQARKETGCSQNDWARLFTLTPLGAPKHRQKGQQNVQQKEAKKKGVNQPEAMASAILAHLHKTGYDVKNIDFDKNGNVIDIPKRDS